ncbi:MAG: GAF domain-containing protein, partial [Candidatus Rokubacteria bacterium]|nr:GAF domain-containing protein [Candidatus Rokubacteria bacterium]
MTEPGDRLRRIGELARAVSSAPELETVLALVTDAVAALRPGLVGVVRLVDAAAGGYRVVGDGPPLGAEITHGVAEVRGPVVAGADYGVPIASGDDLFGVLAVHAPRAAALDDDAREMVDLLAAQAAVAVRTARLVAASEARRRTAEALASIGRIRSQTLDPDLIAGRIADTLCTLLAARSALLFRRDADSGDLVAIARAGMEPEITGRVVLPEGVGL